MQSLPNIAVVILNWNRPTETLKCLESVFALDYPSLKILVVDNGSTDESSVVIRKQYPDLDIIELGSNLGYAAGNNAGIENAMQMGADYILILNNDTIVHSGMVTELVNAAETRPMAGILGPKVICMDPPDRLYAAGSYVDWMQGRTWHRGLFEPLPGGPNHDEPDEVDFIAGCGVLIRTRMIEDVGLLDPTYYLNFEDVEWAVRARRLGFEVWHIPQAVMWHEISATLGQSSPLNDYYMTRNSLRFFWTNAPARARVPAIVRIVLRTARMIGAWSLLRRYRNQNFKKKRDALQRALIDFVRGRTGAVALTS